MPRENKIVDLNGEQPSADNFGAHSHKSPEALGGSPSCAVAGDRNANVDSRQSTIRPSGRLSPRGFHEAFVGGEHGEEPI